MPRRRHRHLRHRHLSFGERLPGRPHPVRIFLHLVQPFELVEHVVEYARREPCVVDLILRVEQNVALEKPPPLLDYAESTLNFLANALHPPAPCMLFDGDVCFDRRDEQQNLAKRDREIIRRDRRRGSLLFGENTKITDVDTILNKRQCWFSWSIS